MLRTLARNWWLILAALVGLFEVGFGVAIPLEEGTSFDTVGGGAILAAAGLLVLGGIAVRRQRSRITGDIMIAVGAVPMLPWLWMILPPLLGLPVILAAAFDMAEARSLGERGTSLAACERLVLAGLVGIFEVAFGVAIPLEEGANFDTVGGGALIAAAGLLVLAGTAVRRRRSRVAGDIMIAVGALPMIPWLWIIPLPLAGLTVIVASAFDSAEARSLGERGTPLPAGERLVLAGVVIVAAALVAAVLIAGPMPGTLIIAPALLGLVVYLGLRQRRRAA